MTASSADVSQRIGDGLLKGWTLLATTCPKCRRTPMMWEKSGTELCVACDMEPRLGDGERAGADDTVEGAASSVSSGNDFISISPDGQVPEKDESGKKEGKKKAKKKKTSKKTGEPHGTEEPVMPESEERKGKKPVAKRYFTIDTAVMTATAAATTTAAQTITKDRPQQEKKVHFAENVLVADNKKSFDHKELKHNVFATLTAAILATSEGAFSSSDIADHYRVCKCLSLQLDSLAILREHLGVERPTVDLSDLHRSLLLRMEKIASLPAATVEAATLQYKTTKRLCRLLARV